MSEADSIKQQIKTAESIEEILEIVDKVLDVKNERIQELEEALLKVKDKNTTLFITCRNSIPKQKVKDKIEEYNKKMEEDAGHPNWVVTDRIVMNVLEELLEDK